MNKNHGSAEVAVCTEKQISDFALLAAMGITNILRRKPAPREEIQKYIESSRKIEAHFSSRLPFGNEEKAKKVISLFADQQVESAVEYHPSHRFLRPDEEIDLLDRNFPELKLDKEGGKKHLADLPVGPEWAKGVGVFVKREKFGVNAPDALWLVGDKIARREGAKNGKFTNYLPKKPEEFLLDRKSEAAIKKLSAFYSGDFFFAPIQCGRKNRGKSVDLSRDICEPEEFLLPTLEGAQIILLHEHLIAEGEYLRMDCGGDCFGGSDRFANSPYFSRDDEELYLDAVWRGARDPGFGAASGSARAVSL